MGAVDEILSSIDPAQLAAALGTDEETARAAAAAAIPTLITGFQANAATGDGEVGLATALGRHAEGVYADTVNLDEVDTEDGRKIVAHALAGDPSRLQAVGGLDGSLLSTLLPLLAPIVLSYLAKKLGMGGAQAPSAGGSGDILGDILGGMLGGAAGGGSAGGLGDLLGQILGGGQPASVPAGYDGGPGGGYGEPGGGVFDAPGNTTGLQIPDDGGDATAPSRGSGDALGDLLGQILGR